MTGPVTTEALVEGLASEIADILLDGGALSPKDFAQRLVAGPALQQVTAERDEARADLKAAEDSNDALNEKLSALAPHGSCACSYDKPGDVCMHHSPALATATSELARLRAEGEAKDRRIAALEGALAPFAKAGGLFGPRESNGWDVLIYNPAAGEEYCITADHLRAARAATAREGA